MRNGLGIAAVVLGIIGVLAGLIPLIFFVAGTLGLIGLILGLVGLGRVRRRQADNRGVAITGTVLSGVAMIAATVGAVIVFSAANQAVDEIDQAIENAASPSPTPGGQVGDVVRGGTFSFEVRKVGTGRKTVGSGLTKATAQGKYIVVRVTVRNTGDEAQSFDTTSQKLVDTEGRKYDADTEAALGLKRAGVLLEEINPGNSVKGVLVFDVPKKIKVSALELHDSPFSGGVTVSVP